MKSHEKMSSQTDIEREKIVADVRPARAYAALLVILVVVGYWGCSRGGDGSSADSYYVERASDTPDGTGRFYMGREISKVRGHVAADWFERSTRETTELPSRVVQAMELKPSDLVADVGAGTGYFTFRISPKVPRGTVYAVDIDQEMLDIIRQRMEQDDIDNIVTVMGTETNPNLPTRALDVVLIADAYHEFSHPHEMMENIVRSLKPGGRVILVEYRGEDPTLPVSDLHRMTEAQARKELEAVGLRWRETRDFLPQQHFIVFERPVE